MRIAVLENHFHDMQDFEFTIQDRTVYMLQTRSHRRRFPHRL
ncbi:MAG: PEP/pyruvate-binding domain-containing protein [Akkermansia sp.]